MTAHTAFEAAALVRLGLGCDPDSAESDVIHPATGCWGVGMDLDMMMPVALVARVSQK